MGACRGRRNLRLPGWDYSGAGAYFVTLCTRERLDLFGAVVDGDMRLNAVGNIVTAAWRWLPLQYRYVILDEWCVMPDHLHGILVLTEDGGGSRTAPAAGATGGDGPAAGNAGDVPPSARKPVGRLIGAFKTVSTKQVNRFRNTTGAILWQRNFWERVVRDDLEMNRIRNHIRQNAATYTR